MERRKFVEFKLKKIIIYKNFVVYCIIVVYYVIIMIVVCLFVCFFFVMGLIVWNNYFLIGNDLKGEIGYEYEEENYLFYLKMINVIFNWKMFKRIVKVNLYLLILNIKIV